MRLSAFGLVAQAQIKGGPRFVCGNRRYQQAVSQPVHRAEHSLSGPVHL